MDTVGSIFVNFLGFRIAMICGGFILAVGLVGSSFAPNIYVLCFTYGLLVPSGSALVDISSFLMVPLYFKKHRSFATAMVCAGPGIGVLSVAPLANLLIDYVGWRKTMQILAGITFVASTFGLAIRRRLNAQDTEAVGPCKDEKKCSLLRSSLSYYLSGLKNPNLLLVLVISIVSSMGHYMPIVHLIKYAESIGVSSATSSWMYSITSIISTVSKLLTGRVGDTGRVSLYTMFQCSLILMAVAHFLMPLATNVGHLYGYAVAEGICGGIYLSSYFCLSMKVDPRRGVVLLIFFLSIPFSIGAPLAGYIADSSGSYHPVFYTSGSFLLTAALITFLRHFIGRQSVDLTDDFGWFGKILQKDKGLSQSRITVVSFTDLSERI